MSHIHFIGGEKGGVGKSVTARVLAQWAIDRGLPFVGMDADQSHGALARFYAEYTHVIDLNSPEGADQIMDRALGNERIVLVDLPAQSVVALQNWLSDADVLSFADEMAIGITFWHVTDGGFASVGELGQSLARLGDRVQHVVVRNFGRSREFDQFENSAARARLDALGGHVIDLPELDPATMYRIDARGASFWAASNLSKDGRPTRTLELQRVSLWLRRAFAAIDGLPSEVSGAGLQQPVISAPEPEPFIESIVLD